MKHTTAISSLFLAFLGLNPAHGQVIQGRVLDGETGGAVAHATVTLLNEDSATVRSTTTDPGGIFSISAPEPGSYRVSATGMGYGVTTSRVYRLSDEEALNLEMHLSPAPVDLPGIAAVVGRSRFGRDRFERRKALGKGVFIGPEELARKTVYHPADALRGLTEEGIRVRFGFGYSGLGTSLRGVYPVVKTAYGNGCLRYLLNEKTLATKHPGTEGRNPWTFWPLNTLRPEDIAGIEVYRFAGEAPEELRPYALREIYGAGGRYRYDEICGVVVIWTKDRW